MKSEYPQKMNKINKISKRLWLFIAVCISTIGIIAQNSTSDKLYASLDGSEGITIVSLSKDIINMVDMVVNEDDSKEITGSLEKVKFMICKKEKASSSIDAIMQTFNKRPFNLVEEKEDNDAEIFIIRSGRKIKECHVVNDGDERIFVLSFYGDFKVEDIDKMANKADGMR